MAQIQSGTTYSTGDQVTATNLNALAGNAILLPGAVSDQPNAASVNLADSVVILQSGALKEATITQIKATTDSGLLKLDGSTPMTGDLTLLSSTGISGLTAAPVAYIDAQLAGTYVKASSAEVAAFAAVNKYVSPERIPDAFVSSKTANGYVKLPGGIIFQWGTGTFTASGSQNLTTAFPIAFPTAVLATTISTTDRLSNTSLGTLPTACTLSLFGFSAVTVSGSGACGYSWTAIGY